VLIVENTAKVRRDYFTDKKIIKQITRERQLSRNTMHKIIRSDATAFELASSVVMPNDYINNI